MSQKLRAIYHNGAFVPQTPCDLLEDTEVELTIDDPFTIEPEITEVEERAKVVADIVRSMQTNLIPMNAPKFTRDQLHERR